MRPMVLQHTNAYISSNIGQITVMVNMLKQRVETGPHTFTPPPLKALPSGEGGGYPALMVEAVGGPASGSSSLCEN